ncbi:MAG: hypothetical protein ACLP1X_15090 [Polyangiaceae bacterium]
MSRRGTITPESGLGTKDGWSSSGTLVTGSGNQPVTMQADFPEADVYTIEFAVDPPTGGVYRAVAQISWTVEGNTISRKLDVANGVAISAPAQAVRVQVNDFTAGSAPSPPQQYGVTISATRGTRPVTGQPPTYLVFPVQVEILASGGAPPYKSDFFPIEQGAGVISVSVAATSLAGPLSSVNPATVPNLLIQQQDASGVVLKSYKYDDQGVGPAFVAISPLATQVFVINLDTSNPVYFSAVWGIEG